MCKAETDAGKPSTSAMVMKEHKHVELVQTEEKMESQPVSSPPSQKSPTGSVGAPVHSTEQAAKSLLMMVSNRSSFCCNFYDL